MTEIGCGFNRSYASLSRCAAVRQAEIGQYTSSAYLLANGRVLLKALVQRPFGDRQILTRMGPPMLVGANSILQVWIDRDQYDLRSLNYSLVKEESPAFGRDYEE
jgi:hypothetical protein